MIVVRIKYYAVLKEQMGLHEEEIKTDAKDARELYASLSQKFGFTLQEGQLNVAINDCMQTWDSTLQDGDHIVFIPPVSGGQV